MRPCIEGQQHVWVAPMGGVVITARCRHCGAERSMTVNAFPGDFSPQEWEKQRSLVFAKMRPQVGKGATVRVF